MQNSFTGHSPSSRGNPTITNEKQAENFIYPFPAIRGARRPEPAYRIENQQHTGRHRQVRKKGGKHPCRKDEPTGRILRRPSAQAAGGYGHICLQAGHPGRVAQPVYGPQRPADPPGPDAVPVKSERTEQAAARCHIRRARNVQLREQILHCQAEGNRRQAGTDGLGADGEFFRRRAEGHHQPEFQALVRRILDCTAVHQRRKRSASGRQACVQNMLRRAFQHDHLRLCAILAGPFPADCRLVPGDVFETGPETLCNNGAADSACNRCNVHRGPTVARQDSRLFPNPLLR